MTYIFGEMSIFRGGTSLGERGIDWFDQEWAEVMVGWGPIPSFRRHQSHLGEPRIRWNSEFSDSLYGVSSMRVGFPDISCCSYVWSNANFGSPRAEAPT